MTCKGKRGDKKKKNSPLVWLKSDTKMKEKVRGLGFLIKRVMGALDIIFVGPRMRSTKNGKSIIFQKVYFLHGLKSLKIVHGF